MIEKAVTIQISEKDGMHPAAKLVQVASHYRSSIYLKDSRYRVNAKSIMGMMSLGLDMGEEVTVVADGTDEQDAVDSIEKYLSGQE